VRTRYEDTPVTVASDKWQYTDEKGTAISLVGDAAFDKGTLYTFVYEAKDPLVGGLGFAALRDEGSFLRNAKADDAGNRQSTRRRHPVTYTPPVNRSPAARCTIMSGLGFNEDESGKKVVDGISNWDRRFDRHLHELPLRPGRPHAAPAQSRAGSRNSRGRSPIR